MQIEVVSKVSWKELESRVRGVPLIKKKDDGSQIFVYDRADISLRTVWSDEVNPTSFYALRDGLQRQRDLRQTLLKEQGVDTLMLDGLLRLRNGEGQEFGLMPPVVEVQKRRVKYVPGEGEINYDETVELIVPLINDGLHRFMLARELGRSVNVVYIVGSDSEFPFYAHPNSWSEVKLVDSVPKAKEEKKRYSREDCYALYRDFGVLGCGAPRGTSK